MDLKFSVVVPTYKRPQMLKECVYSLADQSMRPWEVVVVCREDDAESISAFDELYEALKGDLNLKSVYVKQHGHIPPIKAGFEASEGNVVCYIDDDAEASPDWLEKIHNAYIELKADGICGRVMNVVNGKPVEYPTVDENECGKITKWGRLKGNFYRPPTFSHPTRVSNFQGVNMSFKRKAVERVNFDFTLNQLFARRYEVDICLQMVEKGFDRLYYVPDAIIFHKIDGRTETERTENFLSSLAYNTGFNWTYIIMKHSFRWKTFVVLYWFIWGDGNSPGLMRAGISLILRKPHAVSRGVASLKGKIAGLRAYYKVGCEK